MKKLKTIPFALLVAAFVFFSGEKEGLSQSRDTQVAYTTGDITKLDVQVVYSKSPDIKSLKGGGVGSGLTLSSGKGNGLTLADFSGLKPLEVSDVQVVYLKNLANSKGNGRLLEGIAEPKVFDNEKGNGRMLWKEGHGLTSPYGAGNGNYGISKGAEGILKLK